jgi:hypothetical protein
MYSSCPIQIAHQLSFAIVRSRRGPKRKIIRMILTPPAVTCSVHDRLDHDPVRDEHEQPAAADGYAQRLRRQAVRHGLQLSQHQL